MTSNINYSSQMVVDQPYLDITLIKYFLSLVKEGDLQAIIKEIENKRYDVRLIKDSQYDQTALFYAAVIKYDDDALNVMKYFIEELAVDPFAKDKIQQSVLYYASREGKEKTARYLIEKGIPLNDLDLYNQTPIYYAAREGRLNILKLLVESGSDVNVEDKYGQTCIFYAIREGHADIVDYVVSLDQFKKIDKPDKKNFTPYLFALKFGKTNLAELLVDKGANTQIKSDNKKSKNKKTQKVEEEKVEEDIQRPKKFILCRINENGDKVALTLSELEQFEKEYPEVADMIKSPATLDEYEREAPEELKNYDSWEKVAKKLMNSIWKFKDSEIFHKPVNPIELGIPDYFDIIKTPMDFSTIKRKLNNSTHRNCKEFCEDMDLIFDNCILYNGERSVIGALCNSVRNEYKKLFDQLNMSIFL